MKRCLRSLSFGFSCFFMVPGLAVAVLWFCRFVVLFVQANFKIYSGYWIMGYFADVKRFRPNIQIPAVFDQKLRVAVIVECCFRDITHTIGK